MRSPCELKALDPDQVASCSDGCRWRPIVRMGAERTTEVVFMQEGQRVRKFRATARKCQGHRWERWRRQRDIYSAVTMSTQDWHMPQIFRNTMLYRRAREALYAIRTVIVNSELFPQILHETWLLNNLQVLRYHPLRILENETVQSVR